jgi:glycine oxidase
VPDVIVIGAGVIGAACAWRLAQAGARVRLMERSAPAGEASQAALGVLQYHAKPGAPPSYQALSLRNRELFPLLLDELRSLTGERVPYIEPGMLSIALSEADLPALEALCAVNAKLGFEAERLTAEECRLLEPGVNPAVLSGVFMPADAWVDNTALTLALVNAAQLAGVELARANVEAVHSQAGRVTGVRAGGQDHPAEWVVLAAGCWSGQVQGVPPLPVMPVRGQALAAGGQPLRRMVASAAGYVVPRGDQVLVGATVEHVGFEEGTTLSGLAELTRIGLDIAPRLGSLPFMGAWSGLRPGTPDGLPLIGPFDELPNLIAATGHFRNGILLAPATAEIVRARVTGQAPPVAADDFLPGRPMVA